MSDPTDTAENEVPPCPSCARPLGLYYAECPMCFAHAGDYALGSYVKEDDK